MKKWIAIFMLVLPCAAFAQGFGSSAAAAPAQKKEIKDEGEYNAYMAGRNAANDQAKATAYEDFLQKYPNSVVKTDALTDLLGVYQRLQQRAKLVDTANRLLQADPNNLRALFIIAYVRAEDAATPGPTQQQALADATKAANQGLQVIASPQKPADLTDDEWTKLKNETQPIFKEVLGNAALQSKDYCGAQQNLQAAVNVNSSNVTDVYHLALAYLEGGTGCPPPDIGKPAPASSGPAVVSGFAGGPAAPKAPEAAPLSANLAGIWYIARAADLAPAGATKDQINKYGRSKYVKYHGSDDGWEQLKAQAANSPNPPKDFTIKPKATPAEEAAALASSKKASDMDFSDYQKIFTSGNQEAMQKVWDQIKDKPMQFQAKVLDVTPSTVKVAAAAADATTPDVQIDMVAPIPAKQLPKVGATVAFQANPVKYDTSPYLITMNKGALLKTQ